MASFFSALASAFGSGLLQAGATLGLDAAAALLSGPSPRKAQDLKDKSVRSHAYGTVWSRCRGMVRLEGKVIWATHIQTSIWKTVSGGFLGIGQTSVYYNKYSASSYIGLGKKLGGGAAIDITRIWADGKPLFNKVVSTGTISGAVTVTVVGGGQTAGSQVIQVDVAPGASLNLEPNDSLDLGTDPYPYTVQSSVSATGPATVLVQVWPPLRQNFAGGGAVLISNKAVSPYDLSSFDPNPHDGSHTAGGYPAPPGGIAFYLGSATQGQDPTMVKHLGAANVPGFRGTAGFCVHDLQLANYGDHQPQLTAEVAWDVAGPSYPMIGPIPSTPLSGGGLQFDRIALPYSGNEAIQFYNPLTQRLPYVWVFSGVGSDATHDGTIYRVNTQTHLLEGSLLVDRQGTFRLTGAGMEADNDGFLYLVQNNNVLSKIDGQNLTVVNTWPHFGWNVLTLYCFDTVQSLFGNDTLLKLGYFGGMIFDRTVLMPFGVANAAALTTVVVGYTRNADGTGNPIIAAGDYTIFGGVDPGTSYITDDSQGNLWIGNGNLRQVNGRFTSSITLDSNNQPVEVLALPSFAFTTIMNGSPSAAIVCNSVQYYPGDDTVVAFAGSATTKVSCSTLAVVATAAGIGGTPQKLALTYDPMGRLLVGGGSGIRRVDLGSLAVIGAAYVPGNWPDSPVFGSNWVYDPYTDSAWFNGSSTLNQALLDRGNGSGLALDSLVASLFVDAGYTSGQYDVSSITASGLTYGGWEVERETFKETLQKLQRYFLFDTAEVDGKLVCVVRGQPSIATIPEDDLGALDDPSKYEPRLIEVLQDERDVPFKVTVKYYDLLKDDQMATQEARRILQPYASSLTGAKANTSSRQQLDIVVPLFENASVVRPQVDKIMGDIVAGRFSRQFKMGVKSVRYDPTDVITLDYKAFLLETRLTEADFGSAFAREFKGVSQDINVYTSAITPGSTSPGTGGGVPPTIPTPTPAGLTYTVSPQFALSEASPTEVDMVQLTVTWSDGRITVYSARAGGSGFAVVDPGAGNSQLYYVTIYDPNRTGDPASPSLTGYCTIDPAAAFLGQTGYVFIGTIKITHDGVGVVVTSGGSGNVAQAQGFYVNGSGGGTHSVQEDLLDYVIMDSRRATMHLTGRAANNQAANAYSYIDTATHSIAFIKASGGWAADILLYYSDYIKQYITELDDADHRLWSVPSAYKKIHTPLPIMPRFRQPGSPSTVIDLPAPNLYDRLISCSVIDTKDKGHTTNITYGPVTMNFDNDGAGGGNLGSVQVMVNERYAGSVARERFYFAKGLGFVKWDAATLVSGARITGQYKVTNWAVHNKLVAGGGVTPSFACGYGVGWP